MDMMSVFIISCVWDCVERSLYTGLGFSCFPGGKHNYTKLRMSLLKAADRTVVCDTSTCSNARTCVGVAYKSPA